jgi:HPt (histidine-containing phosphotransfer) domain-containing protein
MTTCFYWSGDGFYPSFQFSFNPYFARRGQGGFVSRLGRNYVPMFANAKKHSGCDRRREVGPERFELTFREGMGDMILLQRLAMFVLLMGVWGPAMAQTTVERLEWVDLSQDGEGEKHWCDASCDATRFLFRPYEQSKVPDGFQKTILFKTMLPSELSAEDVLFFPNGLETLAVYINGVRRYQHGAFTRDWMRADPQVWHIMELRPEDAGAEVLIKTYYAIGYMVKSFRPSLMSGEKIRTELIETSMQTVWFASFFATLALLFLPVVVIRRKLDIHAYFFSFLVAAVAWILMNQDSVVKPYLPIAREYWSVLDILAAFVACPSLLMMLTDIASFRTKIMSRFILFSTVIYAGFLLLHLLGRVHIWYGATAMQAATALPLMVLAPRVLYLAARGNRESKILILGVLSAAGGIFHDILRYADFFQSPITSLSPAGAVALILSFVYILALRYQNEKNEAFRTQNKLLTNIQHLNNQLEKQIEHVEGLVDERTKDIRSILQSIEEGIFTFELGEKGSIVLGREMSRFGRQEFLENDEGEPPGASALLEAMGLSREECSVVLSIVLSVLGEDELNLEFNFANLPRHLNREGGRALEVDWLPVLGMVEGSERQVIRKILLAVRDVTEREKMRKVVQRKGLESEMMLEIIGLGRIKALQGVTGLVSIFAMAQKELAGLDGGKGAAQKVFVKRALHTAKGLARSFGFQKLSLKIHEIENSLTEGVFGELEAFAAGEEAARSYEALTYKIFEPSSLTDLADSEAEVAKKRMELMTYEILQDEGLGTERDRRRIVMTIERALQLSEGKKLLKHVLAPLEAEKRSLARLLNKLEPELVIDDGLAFPASEDISLKLLGIFLHLIRNAMDHGIESPAERARSGKLPQGRIMIKSSYDHGALLITVCDDGRGLDIPGLSRIIEARLGRSPQTDEEAALIVFESGISTKEQATEISGRGVGMDAVLAAVHAMGGELQIRLGPGAAAAGYRPFVLELRFFHILEWGPRVDKAGA